MVRKNIRMRNPTHRFGPTTRPPDNPERRWKKQLQESVETIAVWDEAVYIGTAEGMTVLDARSGTGRWRFQTDATVTTAPAVVDKTVYIVSESAYALEASNGTLNWQFKPDWGSLHTSPAVVGSTIYVGNTNGDVYALDTNTGSVEWQQEIDETGDTSVSSPAVVDDTVYLGSEDGRIHALDAGTGQIEWVNEVTDTRLFSPTVVDGRVYFRDGWSVYAVDATSGVCEWSFETGSYGTSPPAVIDGTLYVGSNKIYALDAASGTIRWTHDHRSDFEFCSPVVVGDMLYAGGSDTQAIGGSPVTVLALDSALGEVQWERSAGPVNELVVAGGSIYVSSGYNSVQVFGMRSGVSDTVPYYKDKNQEPSSTEHTEVFNPDECRACGANLSQFDDVDFCPECGVEITRSGDTDTEIYDP